MNMGKQKCEWLFVDSGGTMSATATPHNEQRGLNGACNYQATSIICYGIFEMNFSIERNADLLGMFEIVLSC